MNLFDHLQKTVQETVYESMSPELKEKLLDLVKRSNLDIDDISMVFKDPDFLQKFLEIVPFEEQSKYMKNVYLFEFGKEYDPKYLLVFRRAIYTYYKKNENFWTTSFNDARFGLRREQPLGGPVRLYSSIMVTTMDKLINHGLGNTDNGGTDGEIVIDPSKPFNDFLLVYKPQDEKEELERYISSGGMSFEELIKELNDSSDERMERQGFHM